MSQAPGWLAWAERYVPDAGEPRTEIATQLVDLVDTNDLITFVRRRACAETASLAVPCGRGIAGGNAVRCALAASASEIHRLSSVPKTAPGLAAVDTSYAAATYYALTRWRLISWLASVMASLASS